MRPISVRTQWPDMVTPDWIIHRDTQIYMGILFDHNHRKLSPGYISIERKSTWEFLMRHEPKSAFQIASLNDIFGHAEKRKDLGSDIGLTESWNKSYQRVI